MFGFVVPMSMNERRDNLTYTLRSRGITKEKKHFSEQMIIINNPREHLWWKWNISFISSQISSASLSKRQLMSEAAKKKSRVKQVASNLFTIPFCFSSRQRNRKKKVADLRNFFFSSSFSFSLRSFWTNEMKNDSNKNKCGKVIKNSLACTWTRKWESVNGAVKGRNNLVTRE